ncbi:MAG: hypothetical protein NVS3B9_6510 [Candidatus Doudnabacteria bacterium]
MPKKTNDKTPEDLTETSEEILEDKPKPRKKIVRKVKKGAGPDLSSLPNTATPVHMDSIAKPISAHDLHNQKPEVAFMPDVPEETLKQEAAKEFKRPETKASRQSDATFLVPEKFGFNFKSERASQKDKKGKLIRNLSVAVLLFLLILLGGLYYMNSYSSKLLGDNSSNMLDPAPAQSQSVPSTSYKLALSKVSPDLAPSLVNLLQSKFGNDYGYTAYQGTLPAVTTDTLFVKKSEDPLNTTLLNELGTYGIKPEIRQIPDLQTNAVLALTPTLSKVDLTGLTSSVYNASGTGGLAKKYCATLLSYKVTSCNPLNATTLQNGSTLKYKSVRALFMLKRTLNFQGMSFTPAISTQVEDIAVTLGK